MAILLRPWFPAAHRRASGEESQDDVGRDIDGVPQACIQVCHGARPPIYEKFEDAKRAAKLDEIPVAVTKRDRGEWLATMRLDEFAKLFFHYLSRAK